MSRYDRFTLLLAVIASIAAMLLASPEASAALDARPVDAEVVGA
ncbi:hypothetical protein [Mycobacteroides abscessus]|nr:hypothetical protein [Mycobacteroides abscessus]CPR79543.1 Uncharacterised protein [Mycobacteroides abscessus]CPR88659.1 Uncharacterised protein [Mycobacteroides abscessus]CPS43600.1 Uncharacterised protein [Mycobacteroides abscessus]CPV03397.1 Uncharacterised protein [Mycobacteroides abscessus]